MHPVNNLQGRVKTLLMNPKKDGDSTTLACESRRINLWCDVSLMNFPAAFIEFSRPKIAQKWHHSPGYILVSR